MRAERKTAQLRKEKDRPMSRRFYVRHFLPDDASRRSRRVIFRSSEPPTNTEFDEIVELTGQIDVDEEDIASEKDVQDRMKQQAERYMSLFSSRSLTQEWRRYGQKHATEIIRLTRAQKKVLTSSIPELKLN